MNSSRIKRRSFALALLVLAVLAVYFYLQFNDDRPATGVDQSPEVVAVEIIDGDTFRDSDDETIRLLGIDTPERGQPFYSAATVFLDSLLYGSELRYEFDHRKRDRYGRLLAYVFADGAFVNRELLKAGLARVYIFPEDMRNREYRQLYIEDQFHARHNKFGIWSLPAPAPADHYIGNTVTWRFHRPGCRSAENIEAENRIIKATREDFLDIGFSPCRNCQP